MNQFTPLAKQIADEAGAPQNVASIQRQLDRNALAKSFPDKDDITTEELFAANRAAIDRSLAYDRARLSAVSLSHEEQIALVSHIVDNLTGVDDDLRNAAVDAMGELL